MFMGALSGRYAVVTGGGKGIGEAIVRRFVREDAAGVAILDYDEASAAKLAAGLTGSRVIAVKCDVSSRDSVKNAFGDIFTAFGKVDVLVNNAGITQDAMYHKMSYEQWDRVIGVNLNGVDNCCRQVVASMREREYGKIVNISSVSAYGNVGQANYSASKAGIIGFTKTLAKELGPKNITVNAVGPGMIDTDMIRTIPEKQLAAFIAGSPARRLGTPDEIASAVLFLSCGESSYISGVVLDVCGGLFT